MSFANNQTAVLLFALPDSIEAGRKVVARQSRVVWQSMRALTRAKVRAAGLPLLESARLIDHQGTFGEQISAAVTAVFARGYERVICVGNDCPDLSIVDLRRAAYALATGQLPIGADQRGGVYLLSFSKAQFNPDALTHLPWQTAQLATALREYLTSHGYRPADLPTRSDINQRIDATSVRWLGQVDSRLLIIVRQTLLTLLSPFLYALVIGDSLYNPDRLSGRAPPVQG